MPWTRKRNYSSPVASSHAASCLTCGFSCARGIHYLDVSREFIVENAEGREIARIDRDFQGLGLELLTDAGKYVIRFDSAGMYASTTSYASLPEHSAADAGQVGNALVRAPPSLAVVRELNETLRLVVLGAAVGIDFDYFSQHSQVRGLSPHAIY